MATALTFQRAKRRGKKLKLGIAGPSGSGKTWGALALARALADGGKVAVIDTEAGSASLYADQFEFDVIDLGPPFHTRKYLDGIDSAISGGYQVLVIDSITHQWDGAGGILQRKEEDDSRPGSNHWTNWKPYTKEHNEFRAALVHAPIHIITTMRSKQSYAQTESGGKKKIEKLGMAPIQREGMEYELTLVFDVQMDHKATASKDRTGLFVDGLHDLTDPKTSKALLDWITKAAPEDPGDAVIPTGDFKGQLVKDVPTDGLIAYRGRLAGTDTAALTPGQRNVLTATLNAVDSVLTTRARQDDESGDPANRSSGGIAPVAPVPLDDGTLL